MCSPSSSLSRPAVPQVTSQTEAASQADVVFVALFPEHYSTLAGLRQVLEGKVLVDVSNAVQVNLCGTSHAEQLADMFPESHVVKGFNAVSAWALQTGPRDGNRQVRSGSEAQACPGGPEASVACCIHCVLKQMFSFNLVRCL